MLERRGRSEEAAREYKAAIENKPNFREAHYQLGHLLLLRKKTSEAIAHLLQTVTPEDRETPRFMYALGIAYAQAGDFSSAQRYLQNAGQLAAALNQGQLMAEIQTSLARVEQRISR
jgi:Flp pilus assembly protein TadD